MLKYHSEQNIEELKSGIEKTIGAQKARAAENAINDVCKGYQKILLEDANNPCSGNSEKATSFFNKKRRSVQKAFGEAAACYCQALLEILYYEHIIRTVKGPGVTVIPLYSGPVPHHAGLADMPSPP